MGIDILGLLVLFGASARLWHLGATDKLSLNLRNAVPPPVADWLECYRCGGFWWALAAVGAFACTREGVPHWVTLAVDIVLTALALNWLFIAARETLARIVEVAEKRTLALAEAVREAAQRAAERSEWPA